MYTEKNPNFNCIQRRCGGIVLTRYSSVATSFCHLSDLIRIDFITYDDMKSARVSLSSFFTGPPSSAMVLERAKTRKTGCFSNEPEWNRISRPSQAPCELMMLLPREIPSARTTGYMYVVYMLDIHKTQTAGRRAGCRKKSIKTFLIKRTRRFWTRGFHRVWRPGGATLRKMGRDSCLSFESKLV